MSGLFRQSFDENNNAQEVEVLGATVGNNAVRKTIGSGAEVLAALTTTNMVGRKSILIYNTSLLTTVYFGPTGFVAGGASGTGIPLNPGQPVEIQAGETVSFYLRTNSGSVDCIIQEVG